MRVVVTGAAGFIGSHVCERLLDRGDDVLGIDAFTPFYAPAVKRRNCAGILANRRFELLARDVDDPGLARELAHADAVCHLAGAPGVRSADRRALEHGNVAATRAVMRAAARAAVPRVVLASSSSVYAPAPSPVAEDAPLSPLSPYGRSKLRAERLAAAAAARDGTKPVVLRLFTVYGPHQRPDMAFARFIAAARGGAAMPVYGDGGQRRDFTYVGDAADAVLLALECGRPGGIYNVSGARAVTLAHAFELLAELLGGAPPLAFAPSDRREHRRIAADVTRARRDLGYDPRVSLAEGIAEQVAAFDCQNAISPPWGAATTLRQPAGPSRESRSTEAPSRRARSVTAPISATST
jgi:UDP-glucuronate 4-epimerase